MKEKHVNRKIICVLILFFIICVQLCRILTNLGESEYSIQDIDYQNSTINSEPEFYGTVGIRLKVGDTLDLNSSVFRIFAKDFYDGDLTQSIKIVSTNVNTSKEGTYNIRYSVANSAGKTTELNVPVVISNSLDRTVQKKLYSAEDVWNMDLNR